MSEIDVLYICDYGQSEFNICPLMDEKCDKKDSCNLRAVVPYKQLQQLKRENEVLKNLHINLVGVKECEIKELVQLKAENEKLKQDLQEETKLGHKAMCEEADMAWEVTKLQKVLDEIYKICDKELCKGEIKDLEMYCAMESIIHKVKEVQENERDRC